MSSKSKNLKRKESFNSASTSKTLKVAVSSNESASTLLEEIQSKRLALAKSVIDFKFNKKRIKVLSKSDDVSEDCKSVVYWMSRDQRVQDNWAFLYAQRLALKVECPLILCFCLVPKFLNATIRQFMFLLKGLQEVEKECVKLGISFVLLEGYAKDVLPQFVRDNHVGALVADFSPLKVPLQWIKDVQKQLPNNVPFCQVDAHNIVPCWAASDKLEYGARTIRRRIMDKLPEYLTEFPPLIKHPHQTEKTFPAINWASAIESLEVDRTVGEVEWAKPGTEAGLIQLESFCSDRLHGFAEKRNDPNENCLSNLSPWFHFGQLSVQRAILTVKKYKKKYPESVDAYIEEAIVRRELADNFCFYCENYDSLEGAWSWAQKTLNDHADDVREYNYSRKVLEEGRTHDNLWNAAQLQMVREGKMHGFLRMYWAKKILEWTKSPKTALAEAIFLNDKYELDGRDPNGYVGCMWSICGVHDQGWKERKVFGKIRFMNYNGCKKKFDIEAFIARYKCK